MANFFYFDNTGTKQGPITPAELKNLVNQGIITPQTNLETDGGHKGKASQIKGLFGELPLPSTPSTDSVPPVASVSDAGRLLWTSKAGVINRLFGFKDKEFYENGFVCNGVFVPYDNVTAVLYNESATQSSVVGMSSIDIKLKTADGTTYYASSSRMSAKKLDTAAQQVGIMLIEKMTQRMLDEITGKGIVKYDDNVSFTRSEVVYGTSIRIPYSELRSVSLLPLNNGLSIKGTRNSIYAIAPYNSVPAYKVLHILARENGVELG